MTAPSEVRVSGRMRALVGGDDYFYNQILKTTALYITDFVLFSIYRRRRTAGFFNI
jgi:hypothetical protein